MKRFIKRFRYGEQGFTLIELLVVVAILGVLAAVVVPNVGKFMGSGTVEAANTEARNVRMAVLAYMVDNSLAEIEPGQVGPGIEGGNPQDIGPVSQNGSTVKDFITGNLQAVYDIDETGAITNATRVASSKWGNLIYDPLKGWVKEQ